MSAKLHSFESLTKEACPRKIILDTNFILNFTHRFTAFKANNVSDCVDFARSLTYWECKILIPQIVTNEFCHQIFLNKLAEHKSKNNLRDDLGVLYKKNPKLIATEHKKIKEAINNLDKISSKDRFGEGTRLVREKAVNLMRKHNFLPSDAYIGAMAIVGIVYNIATLDVYFAENIAKEKNVHVYLPEALIKT